MIYHKKKDLLFLFAWFSLLFFLYYSSMFESIGNSRFFLSFYPITIIFFSFGFISLLDAVSHFQSIPLRKIIVFLTVLLLIASFISYIFHVHIYANMPKALETRIPELAERSIPYNCTIIANFPTVLKSTTDLNVIDIRSFMQDNALNNQGNCILFFKDYMCESFIFGSEYCRLLKKSYNMSLYIQYSEKNLTYSFYKINYNQSQ
jgi:hypothetical protein